LCALERFFVRVNRLGPLRSGPSGPSTLPASQQGSYRAARLGRRSLGQQPRGPRGRRPWQRGRRGTLRSPRAPLHARAAHPPGGPAAPAPQSRGVTGPASGTGRAEGARTGPIQTQGAAGGGRRAAGGACMPWAAPRMAPRSAPLATFSPPALALASRHSSGDARYLYAYCVQSARFSQRGAATALNFRAVVKPLDLPGRRTRPFPRVARALPRAGATGPWRGAHVQHGGEGRGDVARGHRILPALPRKTESKAASGK